MLARFVLFLALVQLAVPARGAAPVLLWDSGTSCNAGAACASPVMPCGRYDHLEILADNRAGTGQRVMGLWSYKADGVTPMATALLRRIGYGTAAAGAEGFADPGGVMLLVGANVPAAPPAIPYAIYDVTSAANTALDSGPLDVTDCDAVQIHEQPSGAAAASNLFVYNPEGPASPPMAIPTTADANPNITAWGLGTTGPAGGPYLKAGMAAPLPSRIRVAIGALGAGITARVRVTCRGRAPGVVPIPVPLGPKCKVDWSAAGAGTAHVWVYGR